VSEAPAPHATLRPLLHAATGFVALSLGVLPRPFAIAGAVAGVLVGWVLLPRLRLEGRLRRPGEPFVGGLRTYPVAVLLLVLLLPPTEAAAAWGVMAFGDAAAALVGMRVPAPRLFGHPKATWSGTPAYVVVGTLAARGLAAAVGALGEASGVAAGAVPAWTACLAAAGASALLDLVPIPPDDNLPAALAAGGTLRAWRALM
jgi:dolichol kinase